MEDDIEESADRLGLPPMFAEFKDGHIVWRRVDGIDYELLGFFLSSHLIVEHYLDVHLQSAYPNLRWDKAKLNFGTKLDLASDEFSAVREQRYNPIAVLKHMNVLRNKLSHRIDYRLTEQDMLPFRQFLDGISKEWEPRLNTPTDVLRAVVSMVCAFLAGGFTRQMTYSARARAQTNRAD